MEASSAIAGHKTRKVVASAPDSIRIMNRAERAQLRAVVADLSTWVKSATWLVEYRRNVTAAGEEAEAALRAALGVMESARGTVAWRVLRLTPANEQLVNDLERAGGLPDLSDSEHMVLNRLAVDVEAALVSTKHLLGLRRLFASAARQDEAALAAQFLSDFHRWAGGSGLAEILTQLEMRHSQTGAHEEGGPDGDTTILARKLHDLGGPPERIAQSDLTSLPSAIRVIDRLAVQEQALRADAIKAGDAVRKHEAWNLLSEMDIERLSDATRERLRVAPLRSAGIRTVSQVLERASRLQSLEGIGQTSARRIEGAAQTLWQQTYDEMPVRLDIAKRSEQTTDLLKRMGHWDRLRQAGVPQRIAERASALRHLALAFEAYPTNLLVLPGSLETTESFRLAAAMVVGHAERLTTASTMAGVDPWADFQARPADYFAMLAELGFSSGENDTAEGELPEKIVEAIRELKLETQHLRANLRGYQSFGARFALVQEKVIIGDEMGLGKTIEALTVIAHLRAHGVLHALVICPAAVVTNWLREVGSKTHLTGYRIHGEHRATALKSWLRNGGVGVTTYETLRWLAPRLENLPTSTCVVVDEAHYVKNPGAQRSRSTARLISRSRHALLLTGTPLENRLDEFRTLVGYVRPDLVVDEGEFSPRRFRRQVAPAYIRRNQEDVLTELPEKVEVEEWLPMSREDQGAYREAVLDGNFHAMRQAALLSGRHSVKMERLVEIVGEAEANNRRVLIFSDYLNVLEQVVVRLKKSGATSVFGPLSGSVPAHKRQGLVDAFSAAQRGAVLVAQIRAGGVGLNVQSASVVVICEPQLKPTIEWQAIARAHRMGQLQTVQVHRLLSDEGVDQRLWDVLARKRELFEDFARVSESAASAAEAYDVSEHQLVQEVLEAERERLLSGTPSVGQTSIDSRRAQQGGVAPKDVSFASLDGAGLPVVPLKSTPQSRIDWSAESSPDMLSGTTFGRAGEVESTYRRGPDEYVRPAERMELIPSCDFKRLCKQDIDSLDDADGYVTSVRGSQYHAEVYRNQSREKVWFELVPEPGNPNDARAVALDLDGELAGYVARHIAAHLHEMIRELNVRGFACYAPGRQTVDGEYVNARCALPTFQRLSRDTGVEAPSWISKKRR